MTGPHEYVLRMIPPNVRSAVLRGLPALLCVLACACGGAPPGAVVAAESGGGVFVTPKGGTPAPAQPGPVAFGDGDTLEARDGAAPVKVAVGLELDRHATYTERPARGTMNVVLEPGARLRRREGTVFDLLSGGFEARVGPPLRRVVVFHGDVFLEVHQDADANVNGARFRATGDGSALTVHVDEGEVLLHAPVSRPGDLHYAKLLAGEHATARPGAPPEKNAPEPADAENR